MPPTGPSAAHARLLEQQAFLRRLARSLVADPHQAEDLAQDATLIALERPPARAGSMRAWLARVVRNRAVNVGLSEERRRQREQPVEAPASPPTPDELEGRFQVQRRVIAAVDRLEEPYRATILLRYYQDLGPSAIAEQLGVPVSTVKSRLARALARLRADLDDTQSEGGRAWAVVLAGGLGEAWKPAAVTALATGGIVMGTKLVVGATVVGGVLIVGGWWLLRPTTGPQDLAESEGTALVEPQEPANANVAPLREPAVAQSRSVLEETEPTRQPQAAPPPPAWGLELKLRGWSEVDEGPVALEVRKGTEVEASLSMERELAREIQLDVGALFEGTASRPDRLTLRVDHPAYLPAEAGVLVAQELMQPAVISGALEATVELVRVRGVVSGTVEVPDEQATDHVRVALFALAQDRPENDPIEVVRPDAEGRFRLRADGAERHVVVAFVAREPSDRVATLRPDTQVVSLGAAATLELEPLVLGEGETVAGQVRSLGGGQPPRGRLGAEPLNPRGGWYLHALAWRGERFELGGVELPWDEDGSVKLTGLAPLPYRLTPSLVWSGSPIPLILVDRSPAAELEVTPPATDVDIVLDFVRVAFGVLGEGQPVAGANVTARWDVEGGGWRTRSTRTDSLGRVAVELDPGEGLELEIADARWPLKKVSFAPQELTPFRVIEIELEGQAREPATLSIRFEGDRAALPDAVVDLLLYDLDRMSDEEVDRARRGWGNRMTGGSKGWVRVEPTGTRPEWTAEDGLWTVSGLAPARYLVRVATRPAEGGGPCLLLATDFEAELLAGGRVEHVWQAEVGAALRLNLTALDQLRTARLLDADGNEVSVSFVRPGPSPGSLSSSGVAQGPGMYDVRPVLMAGFYDLALVLEDGSKRTIPLTLEEGRVNDVVVGPDDL